MDCEIRVKGHLSESWAGWFDDLVIRNEDNGEALLTGRVRDQAALYGILNRLQALNVTLLSVETRPAGG